jgi:formylglycine-generating enzyme required for sulfatase activity
MPKYLTLAIIGAILSPTLLASMGDLKTLKVSGDADKFYPIVFQADGWHDRQLKIEIFHASEKGKLISQFRCHSEPQIPSSADIHQKSQKWVADSWCDPQGKNLVVYLRGGETTYSWRSNLAAVLLDSTPWSFNQLAWLDNEPKTIVPAMASTVGLFNKENFYAFLPVFDILEVEKFSVGGDVNKFYPIVFRADGWHEGLLEIKIYHPLEKGKLVSQFRCYMGGTLPSSAEIHQDSHRWVADSWCNPHGKKLVVYLRGGETTYFWRSNHSSVLLESELRVMETTMPLFDKDDIQVFLPSIKKLFQNRLKDGGLGPQMVLIPAGRFKMGDIQGGGYKNERPVHEVSINHFAMSRYEVTFAEYDLFAEATGRKKPDDQGWEGGNRPVMNVSWNDASAYAEWLSVQTGKQYRLPTEAEWEYAARAGTETKYWWGNDIGKNRAACEGCGAQWGWDAEQMTAPVGSFAPNPFGLYDTVGNVWEWVADSWHNNYEGAPSDGSVWKGNNRRLFRGGSWADLPEDSRAAVRDSESSDSLNYALGFRVVTEDVQDKSWTPD